MILQQVCETLMDGYSHLLQECSKTKTPDWSIEDVQYVLNNLKAGKSKDAYNLPNDVVKQYTAGRDLVITILNK